MAEVQALVKELNDKRQEAVNAYRAIYEAAKTEKRELSADELHKAEETFETIRRFGDEIDRESRLADFERQREAEEARSKLAAVLGAPTGTPGLDQAAAKWLEKWQRFRSGEYTGVREDMEFGPQCLPIEKRAHDVVEQRGGNKLGLHMVETRGLMDREWRANELTKATGDTPKLGYTVPTTMSDRVIMHINAASGVLECPVTTIDTDSGETMYWPALATDASAALTAEAVAATQAYPVMAQRQLDAYDIDGFFYVSLQLLGDARPDVQGLIGDLAGRALATKAAAYYAVGTGSSEPQGVNPVSTLGITAGAATTFTYSELLRLYLSVLSGYRRNGDWLFSDTAYAILCQLQDDNGQYFYRPGDTLISRPVHVDADYPACTAGLKTATFGDMSTFYIRNTGSVVIARDDSFQFISKLATFLFWIRTDSELMDRTGAVKHLIMHA